MPPPAVASTLIWAISFWSFSCICCAWRIICCICCMLPGTFISLLLEIANLTDLASEHFTEALYFGVGQRAAGGFFLGRAGFCGKRRGGRGCSDNHFDSEGTRSGMLYCFL